MGLFGTKPAWEKHLEKVYEDLERLRRIIKRERDTMNPEEAERWNEALNDARERTEAGYAALEQDGLGGACREKVKEIYQIKYKMFQTIIETHVQNTQKERLEHMYLFLGVLRDLVHEFLKAAKQARKDGFADGAVAGFESLRSRFEEKRETLEKHLTKEAPRSVPVSE